MLQYNQNGVLKRVGFHISGFLLSGNLFAQSNQIFAKTAIFVSET